MNPFYFFISCFTASVTPSIKTHEFSNNFTILVISSISSFKRNKVNPFSAVTAPFLFILFLKFIIAFEAGFEAILLTNPGKLFLAEAITRSVTTFLPNLPNQEPGNPPDWIISIFELH